MPNFVLPYEPDDVTHFEAEKRREETKDWLQRRHMQPTVDSPPIAPDYAVTGQRRRTPQTRRGPEGRRSWSEKYVK